MPMQGGADHKQGREQHRHEAIVCETVVCLLAAQEYVQLHNALLGRNATCSARCGTRVLCNPAQPCRTHNPTFTTLHAAPEALCSTLLPASRASCRVGKQQHADASTQLVQTLKALIFPRHTLCPELNLAAPPPRPPLKAERLPPPTPTPPHHPHPKPHTYSRCHHAYAMCASDRGTPTP
jgi:hypothetical protein